MRFLRRTLGRSIPALIGIIVVIAGLGVFQPVALAQEPVVIDFWFPEATANNAQAIFEEYAERFHQRYPQAMVRAAFQGSYTDLRTAIQAAADSGTGPDVAVLLTSDLFTFTEAEQLVPAAEWVRQMPGGEAFEADFFPAFLLNCVDAESTLWTIPFQRSTPVAFYNLDLIEAAGLAIPRNRDELAAVAQALTLPDGERWGLWLPSEGFPIWLFSAAVIANGHPLVESDPATVSLNTPEAEDAADFWLKLATEYKVTPPGIVSWGETLGMFTSGKAAIAFHTTGSLTRILSEARFDVGVGFIPFGKPDADGNGYGVPTGGGNLYLFKGGTLAEQEAAWNWITFLASPEIQADWSARTGYVAARQSAWNLDPLRALVVEKPQYAVARDQLIYARQEVATYRTVEVQGIINKTLSAIIAGQSPDTKTALADAQAQIDALLAAYK